MHTRPTMAATLALLAAIPLGGCVSGGAPARVDAPTPRTPPTARGDSWEAVLPSPLIAGLSAQQPDPLWIDSRRNESLSPRPLEPVLATAEWPDPPRASLERPRTIRFVRSPETFIHFRRQEQIGYHRRWY